MSAKSEPRDEAAVANEAMDKEFNGDSKPADRERAEREQPPHDRADDIKDRAADDAGNAAAVRKPFP